MIGSWKERSEIEERIFERSECKIFMVRQKERYGKDLQKDSKRLGRIVQVLWTHHVTNDTILQFLQKDREMLTTIKQRKLSHCFNKLCRAKSKGKNCKHEESTAVGRKDNHRIFQRYIPWGQRPLRIWHITKRKKERAHYCMICMRND